MTDAATILFIRNQIIGCTACSLRETATRPVPWSGDINPDILIIGEAPGVQEDVEGEPFIGTAGQLLRTKLKESGLHKVATLAFANSCQCFPNRGLSPTADVEYINACRNWMRLQVAVINPRYIIAVGQVAFRSIWDKLAWPSLQQIHGKPLWWPHTMRPHPAKPECIWHTYHPSAALRSGKYKKLLLEDLVAFKAWVDGGEVWPETCYLCGGEIDGFDEDGRGIVLCSKHRVRQGELPV